MVVRLYINRIYLTHILLIRSPSLLVIRLLQVLLSFSMGSGIQYSSGLVVNTICEVRMSNHLLFPFPLFLNFFFYCIFFYQEVVKNGDSAQLHPFPLDRGGSISMPIWLFSFVDKALLSILLNLIFPRKHRPSESKIVISCNHQKMIRLDSILEKIVRFSLSKNI